MAVGGCKGSKLEHYDRSELTIVDSMAGSDVVWLISDVVVDKNWMH